jgi:hypothetical protein
MGGYGGDGRGGRGGRSGLYPPRDPLLSCMPPPAYARRGGVLLGRTCVCMCVCVCVYPEAAPEALPDRCSCPHAYASRRSGVKLYCIHATPCPLHKSELLPRALRKQQRLRSQMRWPPIIKGTWCSGITPAQHAGGPGFNPQRVHHIMFALSADSVALRCTISRDMHKIDTCGVRTHALADWRLKPAP